MLSALDAHLESMKDEKEIHAEPVIYGIGSDADDSVINAVISKAKQPGAQVLLLNNKTQYSDAVLETIKDAYGVRVHQSMASAVMAGKTLLESVRQAGEQSDETTQASMKSLRAELAGLKAFTAVAAYTGRAESSPRVCLLHAKTYKVTLLTQSSV